MLVRCPKCRTTYKVSDELLKGSAPAFRCSRCKHTFDLEAHGTAEREAETTAQTASSATHSAVDEELSLPFEPQQTAGANGAMETAAHEARALESEKTETADDDHWSLHEEAKTEPDFVVPDDDKSISSIKKIEVGSDFSDQDSYFSKTSAHDVPDSESDNILAISSYLDQRASILPFISLFSLLIIGFGLLSIISYANPQSSEAMIKNIPVLGPAALRNNHLREGIVIQSLRSSYQTIQGNREVFLISGVAINQNPEVVREIQLSAVTYTAEGKELERQTIWAGNTISPKIIRGMTVEDIPHLQDLKPLKTFELPPGDSIPFTIVFLKSAKNAKTFSYEILTAEGRT